MPIFPKIEKITQNLTLSHFLVMFGYKLFSLYFPLFLVARGMKLPEVGYTYLLIYLPIALSAPFVGFLNHKINPAILASLGILGYGIYALGMILIPFKTFWEIFLFYFWQVLFGISAALFFVSARAILMRKNSENPDKEFSFFYSASFFADVLAPPIGALFIWKFNFSGVFAFSLILQIFTAIFCFLSLKSETVPLIDAGFKIKMAFKNYQKVIEKIKENATLLFVLISFSILFLSGIYHTFFVLFLKENLNWTKNQILLFGSVFSLLFLPFSLLVTKMVSQRKSEENISKGGIISGCFSCLIGLFSRTLIFWPTVFLMIGKSFGDLMSGAGRSGILTTKLRDYPEESAAIDTIFSPLGIAFGALIGGLIVGNFGYSLTFFFGGVFVLMISLFLPKFKI